MPNVDTGQTRGNHALLVGEIAGLLSMRLSVELEAEDGNYTGRIFVNRPSGRWILTIAPEPKDD